MTHDLDTRLLRSFLTVAAERSFSRGAARLGCSQATMSQRVIQLEALIGVALFKRDYHDVALTAAGAELLEKAQQVVDVHDAFVAHARRGHISGGVRLGIAEDYVLPMLPKLLRSLRRRLPAVELSVVTGLSRHLCQQVEARTLDVAVITLPHVLPQAEILAQPTLQWVASAAFRLPEDGVWPFAFFPEGCAFRAAALHSLIEAGVAHRIALVSASGQVIQAAVAADLAATVMAAGTLPSNLRALTDPSGLPDLPQTCIQIVTRAQGMSAAMHEVKAIVTDAW